MSHFQMDGIEEKGKEVTIIVTVVPLSFTINISKSGTEPVQACQARSSACEHVF